ncbi:MAG: ABC transporter permease [Acidobacteria bacterium]|nr:MAG: ABC transporter permease [Acidobacteriota bacterium]
MKFGLLLESCWSALASNRRRSIVTIVSLGWAVASFLLLMSYGRGFDVSLRSAVLGIGPDVVWMINGQTSLQAGGMRSGRRIRLEKKDVETIRESVPLVAEISPELLSRSMVQQGDRVKRLLVRGVYPEWGRIRSIPIAKGRWLNADDNRYHRRVVILGAEAAHRLFGNRPAVGEEILIRGLRFTVIGEAETKVQLALHSDPDNECLYIPYETMEAWRSTRFPDNMVWMSKSPAVRKKAVRQVREALGRIHGFLPADEQAVKIQEYSDTLRLVDAISIALNVTLAFIGSMTLGIGAVGLANIMFTSVLQRTREIGLLKALGARRRTILSQFLAESLIILSIGGALGVLLGFAAAGAIGSLPFLGFAAGKEMASEYGRLPLVVSASSVIISLTVLSAVGLLAGFLPALRAARLDPVEALRYE